MPPTKPTHSLLFFLLCLYIITCINPSSSSSPTFLEQSSFESDRVINLLPGQPSSPKVNHFSGHITVNQHHGRALFYWFFQAQAQPLTKPLLLWLNGGPGCSSIGYGAAVEMGPLLVNKNGAGVDFNQYSWNQEANLLFVESPIGVGFSYTNTSSDLSDLDDRFVAEDAYNFLVNWLKKFAQFQTHDFYISGESYAGHYVPQLAELVYDRNKQNSKYPHINLKGFIVGNLATDDSYDNKGFLEYAWSHGLISDQTFDTIKKVCDFKVKTWSKQCNEAISIVFEKYSEIDIYNIYAPVCLLNTTFSSLAYTREGQTHEYNMKRFLGVGGYDPCYSEHTEEYFNMENVQNALHVRFKPKGPWKICSDLVFDKYNATVLSVLPIYKKLIKGGLKIWMYSGDTDGRVPLIGSRYCIEALGLPLKSPWHSWYHNHQVGGRIVEYEGLTFLTMRGAGHLVPLNKPDEALSIIRSFLTGHPLPTSR